MQPTQQISYMILAVDNDVGAITGITDSFAHHAWHKQELFKGRGLGVGLGATDWSGWNIEENWLEYLGLDPWKCVIFRRLVCLLLFI